MEESGICLESNFIIRLLVVPDCQMVMEDYTISLKKLVINCLWIV